MIKSILKYMFIVVVGACLYGCPMDKEWRIEIINNTNYLIGQYMSVGILPLYPDTTLPNSNENVRVENIVKPKDDKEWIQGVDIHIRFPWEDLYKRLPADTMSLFIFHKDTLDKYDWATIRKEYKILQRYDLSISDLYSQDFKIYFPPTASMKHIKMYPPFGSYNSDGSLK